MTTEPLRIGLIGIGEHAREVLVPSIIGAGADRVGFGAFCDHRIEALNWTSRWFPSVYATTDLADDQFWAQIDCVVCSATPQIHEIVLEMAIQRCKHCFCEKPAGTGAPALRKLAKAWEEQESRPVVRIGHNFRYTVGGSHFIHVLSRSRRIAAMQLTYLGAGPHEARWGLHPKRAFALTHLTHAIDFVVASSGNVKQINGVQWSPGSDSAVVALTTKRCPQVAITATRAASAFSFMAAAVLNDGGTVQLDSLRSVSLTGQVPQEKRAGSMWKPRELGTVFQNDGFTSELSEFFGEIRGAGQCRLPGLHEAADVMTIIDEVVDGVEANSRQNKKIG